MTLLNTRDNEAYYQLTLCGEHTKVIADAKTAADAGDWKTAAEMIRTALDEIYTKYYEAGDDSAKAAVMNERLTYRGYIHETQTHWYHYPGTRIVGAADTSARSTGI